MSAMGVYRHSFIRQTCAKDCGIGWWLFLPLLLLPLLYSSCSTIDERDECCEEVVLIYRYVPVTKDEYKDHIGEIRHYLFDAKGVFVQELNQTSPHSQRIHLRSLPIGKYTVMSLANKSSQFSHFQI